MAQNQRAGRKKMDRDCSRIKSTTLALFGCSLLACTVAQAAEVTYERILNPEPGNWLTHHHDFSAQRYSTLDAINKTNIKNLKLASGRNGFTYSFDRLNGQFLKA